jgi:hypothetical protein
VDKAFGKLGSRPALDAMLDQLRSGDTVGIWRLDRLGRSLRHLINIFADLATVGFRSEPDREPVVVEQVRSAGPRSCDESKDRAACRALSHRIAAPTGKRCDAAPEHGSCHHDHPVDPVQT